MTKLTALEKRKIVIDVVSKIVYKKHSNAKLWFDFNGWRYEMVNNTFSKRGICKYGTTNRWWEPEPITVSTFLDSFSEAMNTQCKRICFNKLFISVDFKALNDQRYENGMGIYCDELALINLNPVQVLENAIQQKASNIEAKRIRKIISKEIKPSKTKSVDPIKRRL